MRSGVFIQLIIYGKMEQCQSEQTMVRRRMSGEGQSSAAQSQSDSDCYQIIWSIQSETISGTNKYNYLNSYILKSFINIKNIYILAGGEIGIFIDGEFDSTICDDNECVSYEEVASPIDYGIILGSGINLGKNIDCRLTYYYGLRNVIDRSSFADDLNFKHRDLQILIGYKF